MERKEQQDQVHTEVMQNYIHIKDTIDDKICKDLT